MRRDRRKTRLIALLGEAEERLRAPGVNEAWSHFTLAELIQLISSAREEIAEDRLLPSRAAKLWQVFAPTCDWDDIGGDVGLGNAIFELLDSRS